MIYLKNSKQRPIFQIAIQQRFRNLNKKGKISKYTDIEQREVDNQKILSRHLFFFFFFFSFYCLQNYQLFFFPSFSIFTFSFPVNSHYSYSHLLLCQLPNILSPHAKKRGYPSYYHPLLCLLKIVLLLLQSKNVIMLIQNIQNQDTYIELLLNHSFLTFPQAQSILINNQNRLIFKDKWWTQIYPNSQKPQYFNFLILEQLTIISYNIKSLMFQRCKKSVLSELEKIRSLPANSQAKSCILILDTSTASMLSDLFSPEQLMQMGIKQFGRVDKIKKPDPTAMAIYYISTSSIKFLFEDFSIKIDQGQKNELNQSERNSIQMQQKHSIYYSINLLFCEEAQDTVLKQLSQNEQVIEKLASFGELYIPAKYCSNSIGLIAFAKATEQYIRKMRRLSQVNSKAPPEKGIFVLEEDKQEKTRKRQYTEHHIHKNKLTCLSDIYFYEYQKIKQKTRLNSISNNLCDLGKKICQSLVAGLNIGVSTTFRVASYESKFSQKLKEYFLSSLDDFLNSRAEEIEKQKLDETLGSQNSSIFSDSGIVEPKQVCLIIVDRQFDIVSPLVRNFCYEPLLKDLYQIKQPQRKIKIISTRIQPTVIDVNQTVFTQYKNMNVTEVFKKIDGNFQDYISKNKAAKFQKETQSRAKESDDQIQVKGGKVSSAKQLRQVIKQLPEYKKTIQSYKSNIDILGGMGNIIKERNLYEEAELEHLIITGYGGDLKLVKDKKIFEKVLIFLQNPTLTNEDKCRLMVLAVCCLDLESSERSKIITRLSKIQGHGDIAMGLSKISNKGIRKYGLSSQVQKSKQSYLSRHHPPLCNVIQQLISNSQKIKSFKIEEKKAKGLSGKPIIKGALSKSKQKNIEYVICMSGGLGNNQISEIEKHVKCLNQANVEISFLTDYLFTPALYLQQLCTLI